MHGDCYCLKTFRAGDLRGAANVNVVWCSRLAMLIDDDRGDEIGRLQCHASVPLAVGDRRLGMLNVASRDWRVLSDAELSLLTTAGALVSLAVERSRLEAASVRALAAEERNRLAREIHDTIAQGLAALTMQLEVADSLADPSGNTTRASPVAVSRALVLARSCSGRGATVGAGPARGSARRTDAARGAWRASRRRLARSTTACRSTSIADMPGTLAPASNERSLPDRAAGGRERGAACTGAPSARSPNARRRPRRYSAWRTTATGSTRRPCRATASGSSGCASELGCSVER